MFSAWLVGMLLSFIVNVVIEKIMGRNCKFCKYKFEPQDNSFLRGWFFWLKYKLGISKEGKDFITYKDDKNV